jgi:predicted nucleotidyltransferase
MRSPIQKKLFDSVTLYSLDRELLQKNINKAVEKLCSEHTEVRKVILFGSAAAGTNLPSSDVDIIIIVTNTSKRFIDRADCFIDYFLPVGFPVDIFVYTEEEAGSGRIPLLNTAQKHGKVIMAR